MSLTFTAYKKGDAGYEYGGESRQVHLEPGEIFSTDSPCEMVAFLGGWSAADGDLSFNDERPGLTASVAAACTSQQTAIIPQDAEPTEGADEQPPADGDDAEQQGGPSVDAGGLMSREPQPEDMASYPPTDLAFDPDNPIPPEELADLVGPPQLTPEERAEWSDRLARNEPSPGKPHPTHSGDTARRDTRAGDPVDLYRGAFVVGAVDLDVPTAVMPLRLVRRYRSGRWYFGPWGYGWDHNYNVYARELTGGGVAVWTGQLGENLFGWSGQAFEPPRGVHERLESVPAQPHTYLLTQPGGLTLWFEYPPNWTTSERIPLVQIRDRHGNTQTLHYNTDDRLERVEDDDGQALSFHYGGCGLLEGVEAQPGRLVRYDHDADVEHLVRVTLPPTATYPDGASTCYDYDRTAEHPAMRHNILRVADPGGATYIENEYAGPDGGWAFNRLVGQWAGDFRYDYEYEQLQYVTADPVFVAVPATRAAVRPPDGSLHTYTFNYRGDLLDHRFRLNLDGSYRIVARQWEYDAAGNVTAEIEPDGGRTEFSHDAASSDPCARGNLLKVELFSPPQFAAPSRVVFQAMYEPIYQLVKQTLDETGALTTFEYDLDQNPGPTATGRPVRVVLPEVTVSGGGVQHAALDLETNTRGQLTAAISAEGVRHERHYEVTGPHRGFLRETVADAAGVAFAIGFEHDDNGFLRNRVNPIGAVTQTIANLLGQPEEVILPAVDGMTAATRYRWTEDGRVSRVERPRGDYTDSVLSQDLLVDEYVRDVLGQVARSVVGANTAMPRESRFCRDHDGRIVASVDPGRLSTVRRYDERGLLLEQRLATGTADELVTRNVYDRVGRLVRTIAPGGLLTLVEYDPWGRIRTVTRPNGSVESFQWDAGDVLESVIVQGDPGDGGSVRLLRAATFEYDERRRLVRTSTSAFRDDPLTAVDLTVEYTLDRDDQVVGVRGPRGAASTYLYDGLGRLTRGEDPFGNVDVIEYDQAGRIERILRDEVEPAGTRHLEWGYEHDERDRLRAVTGPDGYRVEYDLDDRDLPIEQREPLGVVLRFRHGLLGEVRERSLDLGDGSTFTYGQTHSRTGQLTSFVDPASAETRWERDVLGRLRATVLPDGRRFTRAYGALGTVVREDTPSGSTVHYEYDAASGALTGLQFEPGIGVEPVPKHDFSYDGLGRLVSAVSGGAEVARRYDSLDRLVSEQALGRTISRWYDDIAGTADLVFPDGRRERTWTDPGSRPSRVSLATPATLGGTPDSTLCLFSYGGAERLAGLSYGNGVESTFGYDDRLRLVRLEHATGGDVFESCRYAYDDRGRRAVVQLLGAPRLDQVNDFDGRDRLRQARREMPLPDLADAATQQDHDIAVTQARTTATGASWHESYNLSPVDTRIDRTTFADNATTVTGHGYDAAHRLTSAGTEIVAHHADGARISDGSRLYAVDALGRITQVLDAASSTVLATFQYDALGRAATGAIGGQTYQHSYDGHRWIQEEIAGTLTRQVSPGPLPGIPLMQIRQGGGLLVPHPDGALSVVALTDAHGDVVERTRFDPFGQPVVYAADGTAQQGSAVGFEPIFGGMPYLPAISLYQPAGRLYDPRHGLFLDMDPLLYHDSPCPYVYARQDPVDLVDPDGLAAHVIAFAVVGALAGGIGAALHGGDLADVGVGLLAGGAAGALLATGQVAAAGIVGGAISGAWSGGRAGAKTGGVEGALLGGTVGGVIGAGVGYVAAGVGTLSGNWAATVTSGWVHRALLPTVSAGASRTANWIIARSVGQAAGGYIGSAAGSFTGNVIATTTVNSLTGRPLLTEAELDRAAQGALLIDGPLGSVGAVVSRELWIRKFANDRAGPLGAEGEELVSRDLNVTRKEERYEGWTGETEGRKLDFPSGETAEQGFYAESKNEAWVGMTARERAQLHDFAVHAFENNAKPVVYHRPGTYLDPRASSALHEGQEIPIGFRPIPQQPVVVTTPAPRQLPILSPDKKL